MYHSDILGHYVRFIQGSGWEQLSTIVKLPLANSTTLLCAHDLVQPPGLNAGGATCIECAITLTLESWNDPLYSSTSFWRWGTREGDLVGMGGYTSQHTWFVADGFGCLTQHALHSTHLVSEAQNCGWTWAHGWNITEGTVFQWLLSTLAKQYMNSWVTTMETSWLLKL